MYETMGYHIVVSGYGLWLPGDERGHWSKAWDSELGFVEPHKLHEGDPVRLRMAMERQSHSPCRLDDAMQRQVLTVLESCQSKSDWQLASLSVENTHSHLLMTFNSRNIDNTIKWLKDQMTKAIHQNTGYQGPVWCKGKWCSYIFDVEVWENTMAYIQRHNERWEVGANPYPFVKPLVP